LGKEHADLQMTEKVIGENGADRIPVRRGNQSVLTTGQVGFRAQCG